MSAARATAAAIFSTSHLTTDHLTTGHLTTGHLTTVHLTTGHPPALGVGDDGGLRDGGRLQLVEPGLQRLPQPLRGQNSGQNLTIVVKV